MNVTRIVLAALGAFVAYFVLGGLTFTVPSFRSEFLKYSAVYRPKEGQMSHMPVGMAAMFLGMVVLAVLYALLYRGGPGSVEGARVLGGRRITSCRVRRLGQRHGVAWTSGSRRDERARQRRRARDCR